MAPQAITFALELIATMNPQAVPLDVLHERIAELKSLQREYHSRQAKVATLQRRARKLETKLKHIRGQIDDLTRGSESHAVPGRAPKGKGFPAKVSVSNLTELIVEIVGAAGKPIKVQALADEVKTRDFATKSKNVHALVGTKVTQLVQRGILRRTAGRRGVVLRKSKEGASPAAQNGRAPEHHSRNGAVKAKKKTANAPATRNGQQSLQSVLTGILSKSRRPLSAQELADQARAGGYQSKSQDFKNVIWVTLRKMGAEKVPNKGFRLR